MNNIQKLLTEAVASLGGQAKAFEECEAIYSRVLRTEPFTLSELPSGEQNKLVFQFKEALFVKMTGKVKANFDSDWWYDMVYDWIYENPIYVDLPLDTQVVDLCNYKGEGIGVSLFELAKHLPVFNGK